MNQPFKHTLLAMALLCGQLVHAQMEQLVTINPTTGIHTAVHNIPTVRWVTISPNYTTLDESNGRYLFRGADTAMNWALYSVDVQTGAVISSPTFPNLADPSDNIIGLQFDNATGTLYGLHWDASTQKEFLVSVNPTTGIHTLIDSIPGVSLITSSPNYITFDEINGRYLFRGADAAMNWALYSVDVQTGAVISSPTFPNLADPSDNIIGLQFDNATGTLYGLHWDASTQKEFLVSVNPTTGIHTLIDSIPGVGLITSIPNYTTFDEINGRYLFRGADAAMNWALYSIDVRTGAVISNPLFPVLADPADNVLELQFDNSTGTLYGLHWDANLELGVKGHHLDDRCNIYPNPFQEKTTIELKDIQPNVVVTVFNAAGKWVTSMNKKNTKSIDFYRDGLNAGVYFMNIRTESGDILQRVVIK